MADKNPKGRGSREQGGPIQAAIHYLQETHLTKKDTPRPQTASPYNEGRVQEARVTSQAVNPKPSNDGFPVPDTDHHPLPQSTGHLLSKA